MSLTTLTQLLLHMSLRPEYEHPFTKSGPNGISADGPTLTLCLRGDLARPGSKFCIS